MEVLSLGVFLISVVLLAAFAIHRRGEHPLQSVELRFGADVTADMVRAFLGGVAGLPGRSMVQLDVEATHDGLRHMLHATQSTLDALRSQLRGVLPSARLEPLEPTAPTVWTSGVSIGWSGSHPLLRDDQIGESAAALLGTLSPLGVNEAMLLRWRLRPAHGPHLTARSAHDSLWLPATLTGLRQDPPPAPAYVGALRKKYAGPMLHARGLIAVRAGHSDRGRHLITRVTSVLRSRQGLRGLLLQRRHGPTGLARRLERPGAAGARLCPAELVGLLGWPIDAPALPGLVLGTAPQLVASPRIPSNGRVLGRSNWPGAEDRVVAQPTIGALSHLCVAGPSGVGKSSLIANMAIQDMAAHRACIVIDGKGDLADDLIARVPDGRRGDVIVLDPGRGGPMPGLRVFDRGTDIETTADLLVGVFKDLFRESWGVRSDQWIRAGLVLLAAEPTSTLADFPFVFSNDAFRHRLVGRLRDPLALATWAAYEAMTPAERAQHLASPLNKIAEIVGRRTIRAVLAQPSPKLDLREVLRRGKLVIVRLSPGEISGPAARLLGALIVHQLFSAVQARAAIPQARRKPYGMVYIDEPKVLGDLPVPIDSLYELARGMNVGMCTAVQSLSQLPKALQRAILTNSSSLIAYRQNADDAALLARELPGVTADALQALPRFTAVMKIGLGSGDVAPPVTATTLPMAKATSDPATVRAESAVRYGIDPDEVDAALARRHGFGGFEPARSFDRDAAHHDVEVPLGRRRRTS